MASLCTTSLLARVLTPGKEAIVDSDYRAKLTLGSIVREDGEYLVCIQPSCDALRLRGATQFIFASLTSETSVFDVVVKVPRAGTFVSS